MVEPEDLNHLFYAISQSALYRITPSVFAISFDSEPSNTLRLRFHVTSTLQQEDESVLSEVARDLGERCPEREVAIETALVSERPGSNGLEPLRWMVFRRHVTPGVEEEG
jgi:hypothetical protein